MRVRKGILLVCTCFSLGANSTQEQDGDFDENQDNDFTRGNNKLQPKVTVIERNPARKVYSIMSFAEGSPWCNGKPTYWLVGHHPDETPFCLDNGVWKTPEIAMLLDAQDRHGSASMDVNNDGLPDIICSVGAGKGRGQGFTEVYITQPNGSVVKVPKGHGLDKYPTMRGRKVVPLNGADGSKLVFIATNGVRREDGETNEHRMFRNVWQGDVNKPFFEEVRGPWKLYFAASCVRVADINMDGLDDLIIGNHKREAFAFLQDSNGGWSRIKFKGKRAKDWRNIRLADVTGDGLPDLIVVGWTRQGYLHIFKGSTKAPYFNFDQRYYTTKFRFGTPDIEILDVNGDGRLDIYVVQTDEATEGTYCQGNIDRKKWWKNGAQPPDSFVPPKDMAPDMLLLGRARTKNQTPFKKVRMKHKIPGCGFLVERFGDNRTLVLAQGDIGHPGHNSLLKW